MGFGDWYLVVVPILIGTGMFAFWVSGVVMRRVPDLESGGIEIRFHIVAETTTGFALIVGGLAVLIDGEDLVAVVLSSVGLGMLTYTLIASPGCFVEHRNVPLVLVFAAFWALTIPAIVFRLVIS